MVNAQSGYKTRYMYIVLNERQKSYIHVQCTYKETTWLLHILNLINKVTVVVCDSSYRKGRDDILLLNLITTVTVVVCDSSYNIR